MKNLIVAKFNFDPGTLEIEDSAGTIEKTTDGKAVKDYKYSKTDDSIKFYAATYGTTIFSTVTINSYLPGTKGNYSETHHNLQHGDVINFKSPYGRLQSARSFEEFIAGLKEEEASR